ncbi:enterochelin esterase-like enzyme [Streptacidiphilus sp. MAP12-16]|uniref:alpha/beta hydrolase n=1 Tax=Streptacidiphilus sp. MAP12-16 TaxID=3156300 RepID=UPI0035173061
MRPSTARRPLLPSLAATALLALTLAACGSSSPGSSQALGTPAPSTSVAPTPTPSPSSTMVSLPTGPHTAMTKVRDTAAGPIYLVKLHGPKSGVTGNVWVWLPPEYNDPAYAGYGFPVVSLYSGGQSNGYNTWTDDSQLPIEEADVRLSKAGKAHPFILLMPVQNFISSESHELDCSDIPGQVKMGTWMGEDVTDFARANFRTLKTRDGWGVAGASTGGLCSAKLALQYPQTFRAAVPIDGYFIPDSLFWRGHAAEMAANTPQIMVSKATTDIDMMVTAGGAEQYEVNVVKAFVKRASPSVHITYLELPHADHSTKNFKRVIDATLVYLSQHLAAPTAG